MVEKASTSFPILKNFLILTKAPILYKGKIRKLLLLQYKPLNGNNYEYGKEEVFHLLQESVESNVTEHIFEELLDALVESH